MKYAGIFKKNKTSFFILSCLILSIMSADATTTTIEPGEDITVNGDNPDDRFIINDGETKNIGHYEKNIDVQNGNLNVGPHGHIKGNINAYGADAKVNISDATIDGLVKVHALDKYKTQPLSRKLNVEHSKITSDGLDPVIIVRESETHISNSQIANNTGPGLSFINSEFNHTLPSDTIKVDNSVVSSGDGYTIESLGLNTEINQSTINSHHSKNPVISTSIYASPGHFGDQKTRIIKINESTINSTGNGAYLIGGDNHIIDSKINSSLGSGVILICGNLKIEKDSNIHSKSTQPGLAIINESKKGPENNTVIVNNSTISSKEGAAIKIYSKDIYKYHESNLNHLITDDDLDVYNNDPLSDIETDMMYRSLEDDSINNTHIILKNNSKLIGGDNIIVHSRSLLPVNMSIEQSKITGNILVNPDSRLSLSLGKSSVFEGYSKNLTNVRLHKDSSWLMTDSSVVDNLTHAGEIILSKGNDVDTTLLIRKNYSGQNGSITFNSALAGDDSPSNKLIIRGSTSGETNVHVNNIGGRGNSTINGIELIHIDGVSDGIFKQSGRIVAGAYDYSLVRGKGGVGKNWYLTSQLSAMTTENDVETANTERAVHDAQTTNIVQVEQEVQTAHQTQTDNVVQAMNRVQTTNKIHTTSEYIERPEAASYIANLNAANTLFLTTMNDRAGKTQYTDIFTGEKKTSSLWLRQLGGHSNWHDSNGQLKTQSNSYVTQLGGDVGQWSSNNINRGYLGLMAGYGHNHNKSLSSVTHYHSKGSINGYSIGAYSTWFAHGEDKSGLYVDSWLQYNWFNNQVNGQGLTKEVYKSKGFNGSVEAGYTIKIGDLAGGDEEINPLFIQPQAQVIWMGVKANDHREANGTHVSTSRNSNIQTRLGLRAYLKGHHAMDKNKEREFEPFIEGNWIHNTSNFSATMDGERITQAGTRNIAEVKVGVAGQINEKLSLWGNIATQIGDKSYNNNTAMLGAKYNF